MRPRTELAGLLLSLLLTLPALAQAEPEAAPSAPSVKETSRAMFRLEEGKRALARGDVDAAITALEDAHAVLGSPTSAVALGRALEKKGRLADALARYREGAESKRSPKESFAIAQALDEAKKSVARLDARVPAVKLEVSGAPGASLELDGKPAPPADAEGRLRVDPGARRFAAVRDERRVEVKLELAEGARETVRLDLTPASANSIAPRAAGEHVEPPSASRPGGAHTHASRGASAAGLVAVSGFALAAAGGGVGLGTMLFASGRRSDVEASCGASCPASAQRELDQIDGLGVVSIVALGVGGAGLVTGVVAAIAGASSSSDERSSAGALQIGVAPGYVGLSGRF
jgi:hypothetical protein